MFCYFFILCIVVDCCVDVLVISIFFNVYVEIDLCKYMLRVGIDKFSFNKFLDRYIFGEIYLKCKILRLKSFINKFFKVFLF